MKTLFAAAAVVALVASPAFAAGKKTGYETTIVNTTGNSGKLNTSSSSTSYTTTTTSGPKGQLQTRGTTNVSSGTTGPGKSMP